MALADLIKMEENVHFAVQGLCEHPALMKMDELHNIMGRALASPLLDRGYVTGLLEMAGQLHESASFVLERKVARWRDTEAPVPQDKCASVRSSSCA